MSDHALQISYLDDATLTSHTAIRDGREQIVA